MTTPVRRRDLRWALLMHVVVGYVFLPLAVLVLATLTGRLPGGVDLAAVVAVLAGSIAVRHRRRTRRAAAG